MAAKAGEMNFRNANRKWWGLIMKDRFGGGLGCDEEAKIYMVLDRMKHIEARWMRRQQRRKRG